MFIVTFRLGYRGFSLRSSIATFLPRDASAERGYEIAFVCLSVCDVQVS